MRLLLAGLLAFFGLATTAHAVPPLVDGKTSAVHDYTQAIRERVFIPQPGIDQDRNGVMDWITADIIRPNTTDKVPAIIEPTPLATTNNGAGMFHPGCLGRERRCMADWDDDGVNDRWPTWYDNYFVPRGYAFVLGQANGTGYSEHGCFMLGGPGDVAGERSIVDWLNGRVAGYSAANLSSAPKVASWHDGSSAMIGLGYEGGLANGVAATGVDGLKTVVTMNGIADWHEIYQPGGAPWVTNLLGTVTLVNLTNGPTPPPGVSLPNRRPDLSAGAAEPRRPGQCRPRARGARGREHVLARARLHPRRGQGQGFGLHGAGDVQRSAAQSSGARVVERDGGQRRAAQAVALVSRLRGHLRHPPGALGGGGSSVV